MNRSNASVETEFANENVIGQFFYERAVRTQYAQGHRQLESGAFFLQVGRSEMPQFFNAA